MKDVVTVAITVIVLMIFDGSLRYAYKRWKLTRQKAGKKEVYSDFQDVLRQIRPYLEPPYTRQEILAILGEDLLEVRADGTFIMVAGWWTRARLAAKDFTMKRSKHAPQT